MEECEDGFEFEEETEDQMDGLRKEHLRWIWIMVMMMMVMMMMVMMMMMVVSDDDDGGGGPR